MLIFDELKKNDPQLRLVAMVLAAGLCILLAGLWWVQVVSAHEYQSHLETQAYRTVRIPAVRGKILDREGRVLAENRPRYNLSLYLDDLQKQFDDAYGQLFKQARDAQKQAIAAQEKKLGRSLTKVELKQFAFTTGQLQQLRAQARLNVANNLVAQVGQQLGQPLALDATKFERAYETRLALPYPILQNSNEAQIARFEEKFTGGLGRESGFAGRARLSVRHDGGASARLFAQRRQFAGRRGRVFQLSSAGLSRRGRHRGRFRRAIARARRRGIRARQQPRLPPVGKYHGSARTRPQCRADD